MTYDQKAALQYLENVIMAPRQKGRIKMIRVEFQNYKKTLEPVPWWKKLFRLFKQ